MAARITSTRFITASVSEAASPIIGTSSSAVRSRVMVIAARPSRPRR